MITALSCSLQHYSPQPITIAKMWKQRVSKRWVKNIYNGVSFSSRKKQTLALVVTWESVRHYTKWDKPDRTVLHDLSYMWSRKRKGNVQLVETKDRIWLPGTEEWEKWKDADQEYKLSVLKWTISGAQMYSMVIIVSAILNNVSKNVELN